MDSKQPRSRVESENNSSYFANPYSYRFDFPRFDGSNLRSWLVKSLNFFKIMNISDNDMVSIDAMHFEGKAMECLYHISQDDTCSTLRMTLDMILDDGMKPIRYVAESHVN